MPSGGRIINVGSIVSKMGLSDTAMYAAAKAAQDSLTASWASEVSFHFVAQYLRQLILTRSISSVTATASPSTRSRRAPSRQTPRASS